jgi:hypothetical protein
MLPTNSSDTSELIRDLVQTYGTNDVDIPISNQYCTVINNYVNFLSDISTTPITDKETLKLFLHIATLFIDDTYLHYLIQQLFNNWSNVSEMLCNELDDNLKWLIFLQSLTSSYQGT